MGHSQTDKAKSRKRILEVAACQIRKSGLTGVSIADLMSSAQLTHGGFYGHFSSRNDLIAEALEKALKEGETEAIRAGNVNGPRTLKSLLNSYLSKAHRDNPASGCAISALAGEVARADRRSREIMTKHLVAFFETIRELVGDDDNEEFAVPAVCMIVGAVMLSRVASDVATSDKLLRATRKAILTQSERRSPS